jgi:O-antigen/teichoic acid export membrane protein
MIVMYSDNLVISSFLGVASVTAYALGYKIIDLSQKILYKIVDILITDIAKMYGLGEYKNILLMHNKVLKYSILLSLVGYGILFFVGTNILQLWVGQEFTISLDIFRIFVMYGFLHSFTHVSSTFIVAMGIHKETSYMGMLTALLNLILSIGLLPYYGLPGVALGTLIAHILTIGWFANFWFYKNIYLKLQKVN